MVDDARERADRHQIAELELFGGLTQRHFSYKFLRK